MTLYRYAVAYLVLLAGPLALLRWAMRRTRPKRRLGFLPPVWHQAFVDELRAQERRTEQWLEQCREPELRRFWPVDPSFRITIPRRSS